MIPHPPRATLFPYTTLFRSIFAYVGLQRSNFEFTAALDRVATAGVIDNQSAHHTRGIPHEARAVWKAVAFTRRDIEIGLVQQRCDAEACWRTPSCQLSFCEPVQLGVQSAEKCIRSRAIAAFNRVDKRGNCRLHAALSCRRIALTYLKCRTFTSDIASN